MFKIHFKNQLLLLIVLITFSSVVYSDIPMIAKCALYPSSVNNSGPPFICTSAHFPGSSFPIFSSVYWIVSILWPVAIAFTLAFLIIKLFKKAANKVYK